MARIKRDDSSWKARSILRRDARHDLENLSDEASNGHVRRPQRKSVKGCQHEYPEATQDPRRYGKLRCIHCGKGRYFYNGSRYHIRPRYIDRTEVNGKALAQEGFYPIHDEGTCVTCDERRRRQAGR